MRVKILLLLLCSVLLSASSWAQYGSTLGGHIQDITTSCKLSGGVNCWKALPAHSFTSVSVGSDAFTTFLDASGNIWTYNFSTESYVEQTTWGTAHGLAVVSGNTIYGLLSDSACPTGGYQVSQLNVSNGTWTRFPAWCFNKIAASRDGYIIAGWTDGTIWETNNPAAGSWTWLWGGTGYTPATQISIASATQILAVRSDGTANLYNGSTWTQQATGVLSCQITKQGRIYCLSAPYGNNTWLFDHSIGCWSCELVSPTMGSLAGVLKNIIVGLDSNGQPYHLNLLAGGFQANLYGSSNGCPVQTCPPGAVHTGTVQVSIPNGFNGQAASGNYSPSSNMNLLSADFSGSCDLIFGNPNDPACNPNATSSVYCHSSLQNIFTGIPLPCILPSLNIINPDEEYFPGGSKINVYFDGSGANMNAANTSALFSGIDGWAVPPYNSAPFVGAYTFVNKGIVTTSNSCGYASVPRGGGHYYYQNLPCNPAYPFIIVGQTPTPDLNGYSMSPAEFGGGGSNKWYAAILIPIEVLTQTSGFTIYSDYTFGAHEMGHLIGLADCYGGASCPTKEQQTVMYGQYDSSQPTEPTTCDYSWANVYWEFFN